MTPDCTIRRILIANRGEIAIRIARAAAELGIGTVAIHSEDDAAALHIREADTAVALSGSGPRAYLDIPAVIGAAVASGCDAVHPGYGFLSENAEFARACAANGLIFIGPSPEALDLFGDKVRARGFAQDHAVPVPPGTFGPTTPDEAKAFFAGLPAGAGMMVKALAGGGGRGMRVVRTAAEIGPAFASCTGEALGAFGDGTLYVEQLIPQCRHVEVQIVGDGSDRPVALGERECSLQRRNQKVIEIAPALDLPERLRAAMAEASIRMAGAAGYRGLGTFEFLVPLDRPEGFYFIEANPRVQVEHTVTDQVFGVDLVKAQIRLLGGATLDSLGLRDIAAAGPRGMAIQCRVNLETIDASGEIAPSAGEIEVYEPPTGLGLRVDGFGYAGYRNSLRFDSLLAKLIVFGLGNEDFPTLLARARRAVRDFTVEGVATSLDFLANLLERPELATGRVHTRFIDDHMADLTRPRPPRAPRRPRQAAAAAAPADEGLAEGEVAVQPPMNGMLVELLVEPGATVARGQPVAVIEAMKMQITVEAPEGGRVLRILPRLNDVVAATRPLMVLRPEAGAGTAGFVAEAQDLTVIRPDLAELFERLSYLEDEARPAAVAKRHALGKRTARENLHDLVDEGSFLEYGAFAVAAQRTRHGMDHLIRNTPADGVITGVGRINSALVGEDRAPCVVVIYDYTVLAGTQGYFNHKKQDRIFALAARLNRPIVIYAEGGGGRPGDVDKDILAGGGVGVPTFAMLGRLSGRVPIVGVVSGRCFAGNAAILGSCDVVIATEDTNLGMAGPAMIEGGGLGVFRPEEIGPTELQDRIGTIDILVRDEAEATAAARQYLSYFQGPVPDWTCADQRALRFAVPENRKKAFSIRQLIETLCDEGSVLEMRSRFGRGLITALVRIEGRPLGLIANDSTVLGGALDADASVKGTHFLKLCDAFDIPVISLVDTPGFMVGPEAEAEALVRKACGLFVSGANLDIPIFTVVVRKCYGLGAQASAAGYLTGSTCCVGWPTSELGGMGFEGAVRLAYRKELAAIEDPVARQAEFERLVNEMYMRGRGLNAASVLELDTVIDPAETRHWIVELLDAVGQPDRRRAKKRNEVSTW